MLEERARLATRGQRLHSRLVITGPQCRAARALLGWSIQKLSEESGVSTRSIHTCERAPDVPRMTVTTLERIEAALAAAGVEFIRRNNGGIGVRLR